MEECKLPVDKEEYPDDPDSLANQAMGLAMFCDHFGENANDETALAITRELINLCQLVGDREDVRGIAKAISDCFKTPLAEIRL